MPDSRKLLVTPRDILPSFPDCQVLGAFNPAAVRLPNRKIMLLARVAEQTVQKRKGSFHCPVIAGRGKFAPEKISEGDIAWKTKGLLYLRDRTCRLTTISHFRKIILSKDGFGVESITQKPFFTGTAEEGQYGVEDPRITKLSGEYAMTYVTVSLHEGVSTSLAISKNLCNWRRLGIIFREENKDVVLFPEKINGKYVALHRPRGFFEFSRPSIWISYSRDLLFWGREKTIVHPRAEAWDSYKVGAGAVPLKTREGWLEIYHGVERLNGKNVYRAGALLLDLKNPEKVIARSPPKKPLFSPKNGFEKKGFVNNVVFATAVVPDLDGKALLVYYGAADRVIAVKRVSLKQVLNSMHYY